MQGIKGSLEHFDFTYFDETEAERVNGSELSPAIAIIFVCCRPSAERIIPHECGTSAAELASFVL